MSQSEFTSALLDPDRPVPDGLLDGFGGGAGKRFSVYRNNVVVSLIEALESGFPAVRALLGDENFRNVARDYVRSEPPTSPLMMLYGKGFAGFLESLPQLAAVGYLPDVARLEYALRESYHAPDAEPIAPETLASVAPEVLGAVRLTLAPSVRLIVSPWPVLSLWRYSTGRSAEKPAAKGEAVLIARPEFDPVAEVLPAGGFEFLTALGANKALEASVIQATEVAPDFDLSTVLSTLLATQAITGIKH